MRQQDADAEATIEITRRVLVEFPYWAIAEGCMLIARGKAGLDRRWPPSDGEIHGVMAEIVRTYQRHLANAEALLAAPVEKREEQPRPSRDEVEAKLGRPIGPVKQVTLCDDDYRAQDDGKHALRVAADLEARRARNAAREAGEGGA